MYDFLRTTTVGPPPGVAPHPDRTEVVAAIEAVVELTAEGVEVDGELQVAEATWVIYGHISYEGEIIVGEYHDADEAAEVLRAVPRPDDGGRPMTAHGRGRAPRSPPRTRTRATAASGSWPPPTPGWSPSPIGCSGASRRPTGPTGCRSPSPAARRPTPTPTSSSARSTTTGCSRSRRWRPTAIGATRSWAASAAGPTTGSAPSTTCWATPASAPGFDRDGELATWRAQERFHTPLARWALATELPGQHSVLWTTGQVAEPKAILLEPRLLGRSVLAFVPTHPATKGRS